MSDQNSFSAFEPFIFPKFSILGELSISEVFQFYDFPLCFLATNRTGAIFLSSLYDYEDELLPKWYLLPVSTTRFQEIRSGSMDLYSAFVLPETQVIYSTCKERIEALDISTLDSETFPRPGTTLEVKTHTKNISLIDLEDYAVASHREAVDISFENERFKKTVYPIRQLGQHLRLFQDVVDTIPFSRSQDSNTRGKIPNSSLSETELGFVENYAASFGVRMVSLNPLHVLFGPSTLEECLNKLFDLFELSPNLEEMKLGLEPFSSRTINKYINFLKTLSYSKTSIKAKFVTPKRLTRKFYLSADKAESLIPLLTKVVEDEPLEYEIEGLLIGLVVTRRTFVIQCERDGKTVTFTGTVLDSHLKDASYATINQMYTFKIRETESYNVINDESKIEYALLEILTNLTS